MAARDPSDRNEGPGKGGRAERLAAALKQNLKRRKAQARGRAEAEDPSAPPREASQTGKDGENQ